MKLYSKLAFSFLAVLFILCNLGADNLYYQRPRSATASGESRIQLDPVCFYGHAENPEYQSGFARIKVVSFDTTIAGVGRITVDYFLPPLDLLYVSCHPESRIIQTGSRGKFLPSQTNWFKMGWI